MAKTFDEFVKETIGQFIDFDGVYGNQCVDLIKKYVEEVLVIPAWKSNAHKYLETYPKDKFDFIENTPEGIPEAGDIVLFDDSVGEFGHVSIALGAGDENQFKSLDENWPKGSPVNIVRHGYNGVIGWLRFKDNPTDEQNTPPSSPENTPNGEAGAEESVPRTYRVHRGDSLSKIAQTFLGDGNRWPEVFEMNRDQIDNPDLIFPGTILKLPEA